MFFQAFNEIYLVPPGRLRFRLGHSCKNGCDRSSEEDQKAVAFTRCGAIKNLTSDRVKNLNRIIIQR